MLDLEAITLRHLTEDKMEGKTFHEGHIVIDLFNCVREVERLRAEVERLRSINDEYLLEMGRQHAKLREQALEAKRERAAVVAYLRRRPVVWRGASSPAFIMDANDIERGEHRREEKT